MNILEDKLLKDEHDWLNHMKIEEVKDEQHGYTLGEYVEGTAIDVAKAAFLDKREPGKINLDPHREQKEQCQARCSARLRAIDEQATKVETMKPAARKRVRDANGVPEQIDAILREMDTHLKRLGAAGHLLESLYSDLAAGDLLGSGLGWFAWPHSPGVETDPQSPLSLWRREAAQHGYDFQSSLSTEDVIERRRDRLQAEADSLKVSMLEAHGMPDRLQTLKMRERGLKAAEETLAKCSEILV